MQQNSDNMYHYLRPLWYANACLGISNPFVFIIPNYGRRRIACRYLFDILCIGAVIEVVWIALSSASSIAGILMGLGYIARAAEAFASVVYMIANICKRKELLLVTKQLYTIEKQISELGEWIPHERNQQLIKGLLITIVIPVFICIYNNFIIQRGVMDDVVTIIMDYYLLLMNIGYTAQFVALGLAIERLYKMINNMLVYTLANPNRKFSVHKKGEYVKGLYTLQVIQNKIYRTAISFNDVHSFSLLIMYAAYFLLMFKTTYHCLYAYEHKENPYALPEYLLHIVEMIDTSLRISIVTAVSERIAKERAETGEIIYNLPLGNEDKLKHWVG